MSSVLSDKEYLRYGRHLLLSEIGEEGQQKLKAAKVLIVGVGGLGSPAALYLAAAGIGSLVLVDDDKVELSNLQRQILFSSAQIGQSKTQCTKNTLAALNPNVDVTAIDSRITDENATTLIRGIDIVLDCSDNMATRMTVNRACVEQSTPLVSGAAIGFSGQLVSFSMISTSPCYQCLYPEPSEQVQNCQNAGVVSPLVGVIGSMQALQAINLLIADSLPKTTELHRFDAKTLRWQTLNVKSDPECVTCGSQPEQYMQKGNRHAN